jgi:hypothetical protein
MDVAIDGRAVMDRLAEMFDASPLKTVGDLARARKPPARCPTASDNTRSPPT